MRKRSHRLQQPLQALQEPRFRLAADRTGAPARAASTRVELSNAYALLKPQREWRPGKLKADIAAEVANVVDSATPEIGYSISQPPMAISTAPGSEVQRPLATVVIGGLVSSTLLTLLVLPTVHGLVRRRRGAMQPQVAERAST